MKQHTEKAAGVKSVIGEANACACGCRVAYYWVSMLKTVDWGSGSIRSFSRVLYIIKKSTAGSFCGEQRGKLNVDVSCSRGSSCVQTCLLRQKLMSKDALASIS